MIVTMVSAMSRAHGDEASPNLPAPATPSPGLHYHYPVPKLSEPRVSDVDVCVYGGTPGGVGAAVQAARMGKSAALVVSRRHVGGITSGGLTATDVGNRAAIGGMANEFYDRVGMLRGFRPSKAEEVFRTLLAEAKVPVHFEHRLAGVEKDGDRITLLRCENGASFRAKMFVDATYEGDLLAAAGVSHHVGRESNETYGETINGIQFRWGHNFLYPVDPYKVEGKPESGLLWGISDAPPGEPGTGDDSVQAYCFRMWLTDAADRVPFPKPADYDPDRYALHLRYLLKRPPGDWKFGYPNGPFQLQNGDCNNAGPTSTDFIGGNVGWPGGDATTREKIFQDHVAYQQGLMYFMANDPRVPEPMRAKVNSFGLPRDEFPETGHWPHELYVREARRMVSDYVMTEANCRSKRTAEDPVGLASYNMDSHNARRVVVDGLARNEGDVQVGCPKPYPVSYRSVVPKKGECANLLVPVALSASHIAYGSIRMEPVFLILGQSTGAAASLAIDGATSVQDVPYSKLRDVLLKANQVLEYTGPARSDVIFIAPKSIPGIVVDDAEAVFVGEWERGASVSPIVGEMYFHDGDADKGKKTASFRPNLPEAGRYEVSLHWSAFPNRAPAVPVTITHPGGTTRVTIDQRSKGGWFTIYTGAFDAGRGGSVMVSNEGTKGHVIVDAARWLPVAAAPAP
jgi:hypothetical protein